MRHPFDGINTPAKPSRRSWLGAALAAAAGLFALGSRSEAVAPPRRFLDETDPEPKRKPTVGLNEQGTATPTTKALREEAAMTRALNENGGVIRPGITTLALGEEGGNK